MFDRLTLSEDLVDCRGVPVARRGTVVSPESIAEAAREAPEQPRRALRDTSLAADVRPPLDDPGYRHLFDGAGVRDAVAEALLAVALPAALVDELVAARREGAPFHRHGFATAAVAVRMYLAAAGRAPGIPDLAAAALLHDLGMRHLPSRLHAHQERLGDDDALRIAAHPLVGAYHLATVLGPHPAVQAARSHHWRCGQGYPGGLATAPPRSVEVVAVASAFAALTQPRAYRSGAFDARGAADVLVEDANAGQADANMVKLLVHALRGGQGDASAVRLGHGREGHGPLVNRHTPVAPPARSHV
jgi:HD-GYP domain-containing protein (c-di-GMP phosphodiesterase class II)